MGIDGEQESLVIVSERHDHERHIRWQGSPEKKAEALDDLIEEQFVDEQPWGMEASIDLFGCDPVAIRDGEMIRTFAVALCRFIRMRRYQDPIVVHFGAHERVSGFSLVQLIETSAISGHFIEQVDAACLNIFSCAIFRPYAAARFCQEWFGAREVQATVVFRGPVQGKRQPRAEGQSRRPREEGGEACSSN
jgi:S-adenosylmethionine/arginine decarboxylase-like enzyme